MASVLQDRLSGLAPATGETETIEGSASDENSGEATEVTETTTTPVVAPATEVSDPGVDDEMASAIQARDFSAFLRAAEKRALQQEQADLVVG